MQDYSSLKKFDMANYVESDQDAAYYLGIVAAEDPDRIPAALGVVARARGMSDLAAKTGLSRETLYKTLSDDGNPTFRTMKKILDAYGVEMVLQPAQQKLAQSTAIAL